MSWGGEAEERVAFGFDGGDFAGWRIGGAALCEGVEWGESSGEKGHIEKCEGSHATEGREADARAGVALLQFLESFDRLLPRPTVFLSPSMVGRRTDFQLLADFLHALASSQWRRRLAEFLHDLYRSMSWAFHHKGSAGLPRHQNLRASGSTFGEHSSTTCIRNRELASGGVNAHP